MSLFVICVNTIGRGGDDCRTPLAYRQALGWVEHLHDMLSSIEHEEAPRAPVDRHAARRDAPGDGA